MVDIKELRIGNFLHGKDGTLVEVSATDFVAFMDPEGYFSLSDCSGVPITPAGLELLGFYSEGIKRNEWYIITDNGEGPNIYWFNGNVEIGTYDYQIKLHHIKHIHQLQNLYFALTGQELNIKPE